MARTQLQNINFKYPWSTKNRDLVKAALNDVIALADVLDPGAVQVSATGITTGLGGINPIYTAGSAAYLPGGIGIMLSVSLADAATQNVDFVVSKKIEVIDCSCIKTVAGAGNTVQIALGTIATPITDAIATAVDGALTRAAVITTANSTLVAGNTLRLTSTRAAGSQAVRVNVLMMLRA